MDEIEAHRFQIDLKAAVRTLGRFLLPSAEDAFLKLVQFGVSQKAAGMTINSTPSGFLVHYLGLSEATPAAEMLSQMPEVLAGDLRDRRLPLLSAINYLVHHGAEVGLTVVQGGQIVDTARSANFPSQAARFPSDGRFAEAVSLEIYARTFIELDAHGLKQRLAYCSMPVSWKGKQLNGDRAAAGCWAAYGKPIRQEFSSEGQRRGLEINVEVKNLSESERQGSTEVVPVQWGVALDPIPLQAGGPGVRLIVPADEVETLQGAFKLKPCMAWTDREGVVAGVAKSVSASVHGKARTLRAPRFGRRLNAAQKSSVKFFFLMLAADLLIVYPKWVESNHRPNELSRMLGELQPYLPYIAAAQIIWLMWQVMIAG